MKKLKICPLVVAILASSSAFAQVSPETCDRSITDETPEGDYSSGINLRVTWPIDLKPAIDNWGNVPSLYQNGVLLQHQDRDVFSRLRETHQSFCYVASSPALNIAVPPISNEMVIEAGTTLTLRYGGEEGGSEKPAGQTQFINQWRAAGFDNTAEYQSDRSKPGVAITCHGPYSFTDRKPTFIALLRQHLPRNAFEAALTSCEDRNARLRQGGRPVNAAPPASSVQDAR